MSVGSSSEGHGRQHAFSGDGIRFQFTGQQIRVQEINWVLVQKASQIVERLETVLDRVQLELLAVHSGIYFLDLSDCVLLVTLDLVVFSMKCDLKVSKVATIVVLLTDTHQQQL